MKRIQLKSLRGALPRSRSKSPSPRPIEEFQLEKNVDSDESGCESLPTPKRKERKNGLFKSIRLKFSANFQRKRASSNNVIFDEQKAKGGSKALRSNSLKSVRPRPPRKHALSAHSDEHLNAVGGVDALHSPHADLSISSSIHRNDMYQKVSEIHHTVALYEPCRTEKNVTPVYDQVKDLTPTWSLTKELFRLSKFGWYWGPITRIEAEKKLASQPDGAFLVRDSSDERYLLSLSFRSYGRTLHTRIEHCNGMFSFYHAQTESEGYSSIVDLIENSMSNSQTGVFCYSRALTSTSPSFPVRLTKTVSRFTQVRSLQYLCRFVIRQYTRFDHIQRLPLPDRIKGWLEENQY